MALKFILFSGKHHLVSSMLKIKNQSIVINRTLIALTRKYARLVFGPEHFFHILKSINLDKVIRVKDYKCS